MELVQQGRSWLQVAAVSVRHAKCGIMLGRDVVRDIKYRVEMHELACVGLGIV